MTFAAIPTGSRVFLDANTFVYAFAPDPQFGPPCSELLERIELQDLQGFTSSHVMADVAHRLMSLEACTVLGWQYAGVAQRMKRHPSQIQQLVRFRIALDAIVSMGVHPIPVLAQHVLSAAAISQRHGLLTNDLLCLALMEENGLTLIASHDADFDRVPGITRFAPV